MPCFIWNDEAARLFQYPVQNNDQRSGFRGTNFFIVPFGDPFLDIEKPRWNSGLGYTTDVELAKHFFYKPNEMRGVVEYDIPENVFVAEVLAFAKEADENRHWFGLSQMIEVKTDLGDFKTVQSENRKFAGPRSSFYEVS
jgi:hypothetical protein